MADTSSDFGDEPSLRFGIICSGTVFPSWQARCIESLLATERVTLSLLIIDGAQRSHRDLKPKKAAHISKEAVLWKMYDQFILTRALRSLASVDLTPLIGSLPIIHCQSGQDSENSHWSDASVLNEIRRHEIDFLLHFTDGPIQGKILNIPRYGVWSFQHGDPDKFRGKPSGFWEIFRGDPVTGAVLQRCVNGSDTGVILRRGYFKTFAHSYSRSRDSVFLGSADWPRQVCKDIHRNKADYLDDAPLATKAPICQIPTNLEMLRFGWISLKAWIRSNIIWLFRQQQWNVGIIDAPIHQVVNLTEGRRSGIVSGVMPGPVRWLLEEKGAFLADPFAIAKHDGGSGGLTILAEEYPWEKARGRIAIMDSPDGRVFESPRAVIELPCHMSYPFLFEYEGSFYCIPETYEAQEVSLFRAGSSLRDWSKVATLVQDFPAVDSTVFRHDGRWWLLCTSQDAGANSTLFAWHADELTGPWTPHCANPLKTDIRSGRPAGTPFVHEGELYRPAQDCSTEYGAAVVINRVLTLTPEDFSEEVAAVLKPDPNGPYPYGLHTVCVLPECTIIDGARRTFVPQVFVALIRSKAHRLMRKLGKCKKLIMPFVHPAARRM